MSLSKPEYVPLELLQAMPVRHKWDDWDPYALLGDQDPYTQARLAQVSDRAQIAFAIGCAEWVVYRFSELINDARPYDFLEAAWASEMSSEYATPQQFSEQEWQGPIRAPIDLALVTIINTSYTTEDGAGAVDAAFAEKIPLHVINDSAPFSAWKEAILGRLGSLFARTLGDQNGVPVPREAMDPVIELSLETSREYVLRFLSRLDTTSNPFLSKVQRLGRQTQ